LCRVEMQVWFENLIVKWIIAEKSSEVVS
jgi:hypothetical protein